MPRGQLARIVASSRVPSIRSFSHSLQRSPPAGLAVLGRRRVKELTTGLGREFFLERLSGLRTAAALRSPAAGGAEAVRTALGRTGREVDAVATADGGLREGLDAGGGVDDVGDSMAGVEEGADDIVERRGPQDLSPLLRAIGN